MLVEQPITFGLTYTCLLTPMSAQIRVHDSYPMNNVIKLRKSRSFGDISTVEKSALSRTGARAARAGTF